MVRFRKIISFFLVIMMLSAVLTGCTGKKLTDGVTGEEQGDKKADEMAAYFKNKDFCTLKIMLFGASSSDACERISEALSKITKEKLNCDVKLTQVSFGSYSQQLNMMLFSGDEFDLFSPLTSAADMVTNDQIQPIGDLLSKYGSGILNIVPERDWSLTTFNDKIYGVVVNAEKANQLGFGMRKDICDELGIDYKNISTLDKLHDGLVKVKEKYPDMYPVVSDAGNMFSGLSWIGQDSVGDTFHLTVAEDQFAPKLKIVNFFETKLFQDRVKMLYQWAQEGLIMPDAATNSETAIDMVRAGKAFGYFQHMKPGWEQEQGDQIGKEMVSIRYGEPVASTDQMTWYVPTSSVDPERAVALLNLMYTDSEVSNLLINGIEGEDYIVKDKAKGVIGFPEGIDGTTATYSRMAWAWPNMQISYIWEGQDLDLLNQYKEFNTNAKKKTSHGFTFDTENVMNEIAACSNIYQKYVPAMYSGSIDPDEFLEQLNNELKDAGIDTIIKEKQSQVDAWLAKKN